MVYEWNIVINKHIEIVRSSVPGLSSMSLQSSNGIVEALSKSYLRVGISTVNNLHDLKQVIDLSPDLVFLGMKYIPNKNGKIWLTDYLDEYNIPYTGSSQRAHELELNKQLAKQCVLDSGLETSKFYVALQNTPQHRSDMTLSFPLFIKPTNKGGGLGIDNLSVAHNFDQLESKISSLTSEFQCDSLVEQYLSGREFSVAILKDHSDNYLVMPLELIAPLNISGERVLSAEVKSADSESFAAVTNTIIKKDLCTLALNVFESLGARDYGRIDIRMDENGKPHFLEANLLPSLIEGYGNFPKACLLNLGLEFDAVINKIVQLAINRSVIELNTVFTLSSPAHSLELLPLPAE